MIRTVDDSRAETQFVSQDQLYVGRQGFKILYFPLKSCYQLTMHGPLRPRERIRDSFLYWCLAESQQKIKFCRNIFQRVKCLMDHNRLVFGPKTKRMPALGWQPTILACIRIEIVILIIFSITGYCNVRSQLRFHLKTSFFTGNKAKPEIGMLKLSMHFLTHVLIFKKILTNKKMRSYCTVD